MRLNPAHGEAYGYWKTPPRLRQLAKLKRPNIDYLINYHAGVSNKEVGINALSLAALRRKNGETSPLRVFEITEWDRHNNPKRYYAYRRWIANWYWSNSRSASVSQS
jgi:hypothetical protein